MKQDKFDKRLYRKVNTIARGVHHQFGGDYKYSRTKKQETIEQVNGSMFGKKMRGLDYTPLFRFLISKVGSNWNDVYSEAKARLDKPDPIFWIVSLEENKRKDFVCIGENSFYSGLYVDDKGLLQLSNPNLKASEMEHYCSCCTHTFNGAPY